jgi:hypothetical protein
MAHIDNSVGSTLEGPLSSCINGFKFGNQFSQRSRHHNSVKYSISMNTNQNINTKVKSTKNSKSKKKNNSYQKIVDIKNSKPAHNRSPNPHYEFVGKPSLTNKMSSLSNVK